MNEEEFVNEEFGKQTQDVLSQHSSFSLTFIGMYKVVQVSLHVIISIPFIENIFFLLFFPSAVC